MWGRRLCLEIYGIDIEILNKYKLGGRGVVITIHLYEYIKDIDVDRTIYG